MRKNEPHAGLRNEKTTQKADTCLDLQLAVVLNLLNRHGFIDLLGLEVDRRKRNANLLAENIGQRQ